jgi:HPt (histidine-containing phosphotransfer) domain-containing protein
LLRDLAQIFHEDLPGHIQRLKEGVGEGDDRLIARVAHTLRGLGASFDAKAVVLRLEQAIGRAHAYEVRQLAERLHFDVQALDEALGAERSPDSEL